MNKLREVETSRLDAKAGMSEHKHLEQLKGFIQKRENISSIIDRVKPADNAQTVSIKKCYLKKIDNQVMASRISQQNNLLNKSNIENNNKNSNKTEEMENNIEKENVGKRDKKQNKTETENMIDPQMLNLVQIMKEEPSLIYREFVEKCATRIQKSFKSYRVRKMIYIRIAIKKVYMNK